ncbi:Major Facilitator Superfamily protein [Limimonas halophila]|uniref:Major Facilitator Superfamily protein n=1 Tax=Limimonas halophila TaxID=1082479 RepID=A0A1G7RKS1_9PROT|nr:MFS transporter [Limimonas halophila]SDG11342.1 Major Facilitator Superfamily protein [Limimonas halophila]
MSAQPHEPPARVTARAVLTVFLPFAGGYYLSYLYRTVTAIIADRLQADVGLSAADLGLLTSAYFVAFAAFQLPLGLLLDRFGPRRVNGTLMLLAALGAVGFALGEGLLQLWLARALIGLGVAGGLMAAFKAITQWFPAHRWPIVNGFFLAMGGLGAVSATAPVEALLTVTDWRGVFLALAALTVGVSAAIWFIVPETGAGHAHVRLGDQVAGLTAVYADPFFWRLAPVAVLCMGTTLSITGLWAGPWLRDVAGMGRAEVAETLLVVMIAMTAGFILWGSLASTLERIGIPLTVTVSVGIAIFLLVFGVLILGLVPWAPVPWVAFGLMGNVTALSYTLLSRHVPLAYAGRANAALNLLVFTTAFAAQYAIGGIVDLWPETGGRYPPEAYRSAFALFWALCLLGWGWYLLRARRAPHGSFRAAG